MLTPDSLARTYNPESYADPTDQLADFERVREYASHNPDHGRVRVGNTLDLPPSRVRAWINGGKPDAARGVETAREQDWIDTEPNTATGDAFAVLAAATYACGGINANHVPAWTSETSATRLLITHALSTLGVGHRTRHEADSERPTEIVPSEDASVLGRALQAIGVPRDFSQVDSLPTLFGKCSLATQQTCGLVWVIERGAEHTHSDILTLQMPNRGRDFREGVAMLVRTLVGDGVSIGETTISIAPQARARLPLDP
ncbi:hypothetical protein [Halobaculum limi]|uniref:hypothetical protein n=1 Tax=Halobaculum limi TaxID=3031916 RepID=UPI002404B055|nr:hypothetical protein [Halobaculum sp. YSMS11]